MINIKYINAEEQENKALFKGLYSLCLTNKLGKCVDGKAVLTSAEYLFVMKELVNSSFSEDIEVRMKEEMDYQNLAVNFANKYQFVYVIL